jgi:methionine-rich copper-binding protein CopC
MAARRALLAGALVLAVASSAAAHSLLLESSPGAGSVLSSSPRELSLRFNNRIEKKLSTIRLRDERGVERAATVSLGDGPADWLRATVDTLSAGAWRVEWRVLSTDGHVVSGSFSFRVAP